MSERTSRPWWWYLAIVVAVIALIAAAFSAYRAMGDVDTFTWQRYASSAFGIAILSGALAWFGRHRTR